MNLKDFKIECKRTCPTLGGGMAVDLSHMVLGMNTEVVELKAAIRNGDEVNILEEISDLMWYYCNYLTFRGIELPTASSYFITNYIDNLYDTICLLQDLVKKNLAYGKDIPLQEEAECLREILALVQGACKYYDLNLEEGLEKNITKLKKRFPDKFDAELAINRDVVAERKILEDDTNRKA